MIQNTSGVVVVAANHSDNIPPTLVGNIKTALEDNLYNNNGYHNDDELTIQFKVLEEDDARGFWSGWWNGQFPESDKQTLNVGVIWTNWSDTQMAEIEVEVEVGTGDFQTDPANAVTKIVNEISSYTTQYFPHNSL